MVVKVAWWMGGTVRAAASSRLWSFLCARRGCKSRSCTARRTFARMRQAGWRKWAGVPRGGLEPAHLSAATSGAWCQLAVLPQPSAPPGKVDRKMQRSDQTPNVYDRIESGRAYLPRKVRVAPTLVRSWISTCTRRSASADHRAAVLF